MDSPESLIERFGGKAAGGMPVNPPAVAPVKQAGGMPVIPPAVAPPVNPLAVAPVKQAGGMPVIIVIHFWNE